MPRQNICEASKRPYLICQEGQLGCRWRSHAEVVAGKGQFLCGCKGCHVGGALTSHEVTFSYVEAGKKKHALVKVRQVSLKTISALGKVSYRQQETYLNHNQSALADVLISRKLHD